MNLGTPLFDEGARIAIASDEALPCDPDAERRLGSWMVAGPPEPGARERVFEHGIAPHASGWAAASVVNASLGLAFRLRWRRDKLLRFHQRVHPDRGMYVVGLEPSNGSVLGRAVDRAAGVLPIMEPGEAHTTELRIVVARVASD